MAAVFAGGQSYNGSFRADKVRLLLSGPGNLPTPANGFIIQDINFDYSQSLAMIYEVGSNNVYFVGGRSQGNAGIGQIIGPTVLILSFLGRYADLCAPANLMLQLGGNCGNVNGAATPNNNFGQVKNGGSPGEQNDLAGAAVKAGAANAKSVSGLQVLLQSAVMNRVGGNTNAQNIVVNHQSQFVYINLDYSPV